MTTTRRYAVALKGKVMVFECTQGHRSRRNYSEIATVMLQRFERYWSRENGLGVQAEPCPRCVEIEQFQGMKRRLYKSRAHQNIYDALIRAWLNGATPGKRCDLWMEDGSPRLHGAVHRIHFWSGYGAQTCRRPPPPPRTLASVAEAAGKDCAQEAARRKRAATQKKGD